MRPAATPAARTDRSASTRDKIVRVAVRLFAERGLEGVSLNDINKAAGQRNKNATHYHFGSKDGLLQAILDRYEPSIAARRDALLDEFEASGPPSLRQILTAIIQPLAEAMNDEDGGKDFVRFSAHLVVSHTMAAMKVEAPHFRITSVDRIAGAMDAHLSHLGPALKLQRGLLLGVCLTHALAEHSRLRERQKDPQRRQADTELFVSNLEDSLAAMLSANASEATERLLQDKA